MFYENSSIILLLLSAKCLGATIFIQAHFINELPLSRVKVRPISISNKTNKSILPLGNNLLHYCQFFSAFSLYLFSILSPKMVSLLSQNASDNFMDSTYSCLEMSSGDICCYLVFQGKLKLGRPFTSRVVIAMLYPVSLLQRFISVQV